MKQLCLFLIMTIFFSGVIRVFKCSHSSFLEVENVLGLKKSKQKTNNEIIWEGWMKYFHFQNADDKKRPRKFFINDEYFKQKVTNANRLEKDKEGVYVNVPTKFHFYGKLISGSHPVFNILSQRELEIQKTVDSLNLDLIKLLPMNLVFPIPPQIAKIASIKDLGSVNEGHCISIQTKVPKNPDENFDLVDSKDGIPEIWAICLETAKEKDRLFKNLINVKLKLQNEKYQEVENDESQSDKKEKKKSENKSNIERYDGADASSTDGYLILLQDWSPCSVKCGGGEKIQQWMCVPPKKGGKPCQGELIRKKVCNAQPCPTVKTETSTSASASSLMQSTSSASNITSKPIIKTMPFFKRPQQYIKCEIRENDILISQKLDNLLYPINTPARIVMNTRTISVFTNEDYKNALFSFDLKKTDFYPDAHNHCCFKLKSEDKSFKICAFDQDCGDKSNKKFYEDWLYSFSMFKNKCYSKFKSEDAKNSIGLLPDDGEPGKNSKSDEEMEKEVEMTIAEEAVDQRESMIKKKMDENMEAGLEKKVDQSQKVALRAIKKELTIEEMIKKEELLKAKEEAVEMVKLMKHEEQKKEKLEQALRDRDLEGQKIREVKEVENKISGIQTKAKSDVEIKRDELRKKIIEIRKKAARRKRMIEHQINVIRGEMAKDLMSANKQGDMKLCKESKNDKKKITEYCNTNVTDDFQKNTICNLPESFCYVCCETEFGTMFMDKREECYSQCE